MKNEQVTKQDFESLKKELFDNFACKQDLENQKTELLEKLVDKETHKQYLENLKSELLEKLVDKETHKQDLENLKKELLEKLVDKETYKKDIAKLATMDQLRWESYEIRKELSEFKEQTNEKFDTLLPAIDGLAKLITNGQIEKIASEGTFQRHERWLEDHEVRIKQLETQAV